MYSLVEVSILNAVTASALALIALLIGRLLRRPAVIHAVWVLVLLKLVTPPIFEIPVGLRLQRLASLTQAGDPAAKAPTRPDDARPPKLVTLPVIVHAGSTDHHRRPETVINDSLAAANPASLERSPLDFIARVTSSVTLRRWTAIAVSMGLWVWAAGTIVWFFVQGWRIVLFTRLASTTRLAGSEVQQQAEQLASSIGVRRAPRVWVLDATLSPILWGLGSRTRVIFPADLLDRLDRDARATLLTHELAHYHRGDHWVRLLEFVVTGLFWWRWSLRRSTPAWYRRCRKRRNPQQRAPWEMPTHVSHPLQNCWKG